MSFRTLSKKYIGDKAFYRKVMAIALPIMAQSGITNFVSLLDNIMVGRLGTEAMAGVSIINQFFFVFTLLMFGAVSAAGIFTAQFFGEGNAEGVRHTFRFKIIICVLAAVVFGAVFYIAKEPLISLFLHDGSADGDLALTMSYAKDYLFVTLFGFVPFALAQVYTSTMRETGETVLPMLASLAAVATNFVLNFVLIFGVGDIIPALGVVGAAIATLASRFVELAVLAIWGHTHREKCPYLVGAYRTLRVPGALAKQIVVRGLPLMVNEFFYSMAVTLRNQSYSTRGLDVVAAQNISTTIYSVFSIVYLAMGSAIAIMMGHLLGAGKIEEAKDKDRKLIAFSVFCAVVTGTLVIAASPLIPKIYNVSDDVRSLASFMMIVCAVIMPIDAFANGSYFTLRSGGLVAITLLSDCVFMWTVVVPVTFLTSHFTPLSIYALFIIGQGCDFLKAMLGYILLKKCRWARRLTGDEKLTEIENECLPNE